jgi:Fic family protein
MAYSPLFSILPELLKILEDINVLHTRIQQAAVRLAWVPTALERETLSRTAHGSTAIEGNPLTLKEVQSVMGGTSPARATPRSVQEIRNSIAVMRYIQKHARLARIREKDVLKIHALLGQNDALERGPIGYYRNYGVQVGSHVAPIAIQVPLLMQDLLDWLRNEGPRWPAVISSAVLHFRFEWIHPFGDGNGRVGRALAAWELYRRHFDTHHIFSIDEILWEKRAEYYAALRQAQDEPGLDLTRWIEFTSRALLSAMEKTWQRILRLQTGGRREPLTLTPRQERLLSLLREKPLHIAEIQKALGVTKPGAHHILKPLLEAKWIRREGGHRTGVYKVV